MEERLFTDRILPYLASYQTVNIQCLGEPLLAETFFRFARACKKKGCRVCFTTNGILLGKYAGDIVESGIDEVSVSLDGIAAQEAIRGISADTVAGGIRALSAEKRKRNSPWPNIALNVVAMKGSVREIPSVVTLAAELGVPKITVMHAVIHADALRDEGLLADPQEARAEFDAALASARRLNIRLVLPPLQRREYICRQPCGILYINWNGDIRPCCSATYNEPDMLKAGNLRSALLPEAWNGVYMRRLRVSLTRQKRMPRFCETCFMRVCSAETQVKLLSKE
jgi:radical SAM protein with 4Fe4S-binding SPASM domain